MAMSVVYATVGGLIRQEHRGGNITRFVPDTLGSIVQTCDVDGTQTSATLYWPYGEVRLLSGVNPSPWRFVGALGYHTDTHGTLYVRARYLISSLSRWLNRDPLWPDLKPYAYVEGNPVSRRDPSGLSPLIFAGCVGGIIGSVIGSFINGDSAIVGTCKALLSCALGALIGFLLDKWPALATCILGLLSVFVGALLTKLCELIEGLDEGEEFLDCVTPSRLSEANKYCLFALAVVNAIIGCASSGKNKDIDPPPFSGGLMGFIASLLGLNCDDFLDATSPNSGVNTPPIQSDGIRRGLQ